MRDIVAVSRNALSAPLFVSFSIAFWANFEPSSLSPPSLTSLGEVDALLGSAFWADFEESSFLPPFWASLEVELLAFWATFEALLISLSGGGEVDSLLGSALLNALSGATCCNTNQNTIAGEWVCVDRKAWMNFDALPDRFSLVRICRNTEIKYKSNSVEFC